jgi:hypothetical protein
MVLIWWIVVSQSYDIASSNISGIYSGVQTCFRTKTSLNFYEPGMTVSDMLQKQIKKKLNN